MAIPTLVQHTGGDVVSGTSFTSPALGAPATAGNCLVLLISGDKNTGALTGLPSGWTVVAALTSASVSQYLAFGTAVGGETTVSCTLGSAGGGNGNSGWLAELSQAGGGAWTQVATAATHITDESTATVWATGSSGTASADGLGIGLLSCDSALNITAGSWSSSALTARFDTPVTGGTLGGGASTHVGTLGVTSGTSLGSTWTTTSGSADQLSASLMVIGRGPAVVGPAVVTSKLEIEFVPGSDVWVDVSDRVTGTVTITRPRLDLATGVAVTTLSATIKNYPAANGFCPFIPNSPGSQYFPNVVPERRIRHTATSSAVNYVRFLGFIDKWVPEMGEGGVGKATVTITASCILSRYARRGLLSYFGETVLSHANVDYWPFNDPTDSRVLKGRTGDPVNWPVRDGELVAPNRPPGGAQLSAPDGGHLLDGQIDFTRGGDNAPSPVVLIRTRLGQLVTAVTASYRLTTDPAGLTDDALAAYDSDGNRLWRWCASLTGGNIVWTLFDDANVARSFWDTLSPRDDAWHNWQIAFPSSSSSQLVLTEKGGLNRNLGSFAWTYDPRRVAYLVVGGQMIPQRKGKQTNTLQGAVSSLTVQYSSGSTLVYDEFAVPGQTSNASRVASFLNDEGADFNALTGGAITPGVSSDLRQVEYTNTTRTLLDRWWEHTLTVGGHLSTLPDGRRRFVLADDCRPITVSVTLDVAEDLDIPEGGWAQVVDERPTRVTGSAPSGSVVVIDAETEATLGMQLDGPTLNTSAGDPSLAASAAGALMAPRQARLNQFGVNLTTAQTDKVAAIMALTQTSRMRVSGLPSAYLGITYQDVYASGWSETYDGKGRVARFVFDTDNADDPSEGRLDDAENGRIAMGDGAATVTGGTCVGNTGTGTIIITSSSPASTSAGDYPADVNWNGERVTVTAPGGAVSPQTFPVTVRGVAPTVARVHAAGEAVDIWHPATATL